VAVAMASRALMRTAAAVGTSSAIVTATAVASSTARRGVLHARTVIILDARVPRLLFLGRLIFGRGLIAISR